MPELPEVETVVRSLRPHLAGRRIVAVRVLAARVVRGAAPEAAAGQAIRSLERRAKHILMRLERGLLAIHLGMTGKLLWNAAQTPWTRAIVELDRGRLVYDDVRMFGRIEYAASLPRRIELLGPEPLDTPLEEFAARLERRRARIKTLLLDQRFLAGLGNIYADEALFRAGIHPRAIASKLSGARAARLHRAIRDTLEQAIEHRGSSISDYVDAAGERGSFQLLHQVYGRAGEPCGRCGTPIRRIVMAQRGTHYCPKCQRV